MFGNPYMNPQNNIDRINQQIQELERMKTGYQNMPQQPQNTPINIYNNTTSPQNDFKAQYIDENTKVEDLLVQCKMAFIEPKKGHLYIKEINGDITDYELIVPKTPEQLKIEELERKLSEYELQYVKPINESRKSSKHDTELNKE